MVFSVLWEAAQSNSLILFDGGLLHYHLRRDGMIVIREILVLPERQRQGIGRAMLLEVLSRHPGAVGVEARVPKELNVDSWYSGLGFRQVDTLLSQKGKEIGLWRRSI